MWLDPYTPIEMRDDGRPYAPGDVVSVRDDVGARVLRLIGRRLVDGVWLAKDSDQEWFEVTESEIEGRAA